ncbi:hypothetical protein ACRE_010210 [Hapsidospora chrysogenum ATCC 11550]|uniref:Uncharacterized protein n=1 Tax=Hapsidospora chrysogenum (strain ATCC 11550 / CBS 779.69 / DSM 880 / IAM 14645 / JCM 23072 / IMI 49137) TaxID=857340 RepID=A0A086TFE2_HAPC1|nr:hypothetical protein ACRE_010210 [Hapsidospora chrysogenum ATCC 11550]
MSPRWETKFESNKTPKLITFQQRATQLPCLVREITYHATNTQNSETKGRTSFASLSPDHRSVTGPGSLETLRCSGHEVDVIVLGRAAQALTYGIARRRS